MNQCGLEKWDPPGISVDKTNDLKQRIIYSEIKDFLCGQWRVDIISDHLAIVDRK